MENLKDLRPIIKVGHSPDADDLFMYYAIKFGFVGNEFNFISQALDIETLNNLALENQLDISAISFALYPKISKEYALLNTGISFGYGYGPKLMKLKNTKLKRNFKVALSGANTTNAMIFKIFYKDAKIIYKNFLEIEEAILSGEVDAGVLIHESILTYDDRLCVEAELFDIWRTLCGDDLPLPLGGMAILRSIPLLRAISLQRYLAQAVMLANKYKNTMCEMLLSRGLLRVGDEILNKYLNMYASKVVLENAEITGLDRLFALGYDNNLYPSKISTDEVLLPLEYEALRFS